MTTIEQTVQAVKESYARLAPQGRTDAWEGMESRRVVSYFLNEYFGEMTPDAVDVAVFREANGIPL